ncbi:unnamed protein product [Ilex paraguariensis]|uniref:Uncharacterized protein n=1 Tax=Ilex paraguariensis TaxID=185542 RepID=A0ABC8T5K6_9AQUA
MHQKYYRGKLESLFDQERAFSRTAPIVLLNSSERRERVEECEESGGFLEEKWRFQAEILRAECNFLRMEREFALKKLERNRVQMERTLRSAVRTLVSGRNKIYEGENVNTVLEEEIEDLAEKLEELRRSSGVVDFEVRDCSNFDKQASLLQRRLGKLGGLSDEKCVKEIQELAESSLSINTIHEIDNESFDLSSKGNNRSTDNVQMEILRKHMEGLPKGLLDRMEEEYGSMLSTTANSSVDSSASTSKRIECLDSSSFSTRHLHQELVSREEIKCSGHCKAMLRRIMEQVRTETEQWSQMQAMLGQVREEMEELHASRDFWQNQALDCDYEIQSLRSTVQEWRQKALTFESKANELQTEISAIKGELEKLRMAENEKHVLHCPLKENHHTNDKESKKKIANQKSRIEQTREILTTRDLPPISLGKQIEKEKRILILRLKENHHADDKGSKQDNLGDGRQRATTRGNGLMALKRSPFRDIGNSSC